ncbi:conserved oligomeric Golgi complex subunit 2 [Aplysia californica]|uniref:Conserved oligomeric Golgi complex subunit 2 n=1 Tax=Aplysia californica TaxID=6500 RepID=A0ABM1A7L9_APLCA|nr:conserved oligomeric Golgi complex subunit 2 [Aplysia californica]
MTVDASGKGFTLPSGPTSLCFDKEEFMKKDFEVDKFILECKKKVPLETLRDDLDLYLKVVRSAMIELINKDYADFVNLSTNLVGMDKAITNLTVPLGQLKEEVLSVQTAMDEAILAVQEKIRQQQEIQRKKTMLQRLMNITHSVEKIERLLGIQQGAEPLSPGQLTGPLIERVATEFNKLQFYVTRSKGQPLVEKVKPRIAAITTTLQYSLEGSFLSGLETNNTAMLRQCLRTYALIDKTRDAEDLFREHVVRPYMEEVITEEFLRRHQNDVSTMFSEVLQFVPQKCSTLVGVTSGTSGGEIVRGYDFTVNAVFPEIVSGLELRTSSIFAPGNPEAFHKKYKACLSFLDQFEQSCSSQASVGRLRKHPSYTSLMAKWSLPVYFQIRFQDVAGQLETALCSGFSSPSGECEFRLVSTSAVWSSMAQCWQDSFFLPALLHRFLKLNFQLLSRYTVWLNEVYQEEVQRKSDSTTESKNRSSTPDRLGTPTSDITGDHSGRTGSPKTVVELLLIAPITAGQIVALMADLDTLNKKVSLLFDEKILPKLMAQGVESTDAIKAALLEAVTEAGACRPKFWSMVTEDIVKRCGAFLTQVNDIPRLYRRTNKEVPTKPSTYLSGVVKPLTHFCEEHSGTLKEQQKLEFLTHVFISLAKQFSEVTTEVLTSTRKMEESLRRLRKARGGEKEKEKSGGVSDSDKIRTQIIIDINSFHEQMKQLGLQPVSIDGYSELVSLAEEAQTDIATS